MPCYILQNIHLYDILFGIIFLSSQDLHISGVKRGWDGLHTSLGEFKLGDKLVDDKLKKGAVVLRLGIT